MKKRVTIMAFVILLLFASASFGEQMNGYREDYFLQRLEEISPLDALLPRSIKSDLAHLSVDQLDIAVTKMSADCETTIRKPSEIWAYVETPGHVVILTRRGKRVCELLSIETHACLSRRYDEEMAEVQRISAAYREERKAARRAKRNGANIL